MGEQGRVVGCPVVYRSMGQPDAAVFRLEDAFRDLLRRMNLS